MYKIYTHWCALRRHATKIMFIMRLTTMLLIAGFIQVNARTSLAQRINLSVQNESLVRVFDQISLQSGYDFIVASSLLNDAPRVSIQVSGVSLNDVLDQLLRDQPLTYSIEDKTVIIKRKEEGLADRLRGYFNPDRPTPAQPPVVTGVVTDSLGNPLKGVSVVLKERKVKVVTGSAGEFRIDAAEGSLTLIFTYLGMERQEIHLAAPQTGLRVVMKISQEALEDVVVTGYSNIRKESFTGNSIKVTKDQMLKVGNRNIMSILQVFDPSFRLEKNNLRGSDPNTLPEFYVRGRSGIGVKELDNADLDLSQAALTNNPNLPIFIMDGYEITAQKVYDYDINRIKDITILKDAAATAVYGSRAANGVVVIETIPPMPGKFQVNYTEVTTLTAPDLSDYHLMNSAQKVEAEKLAGYYNLAGWPPANQALMTDEYLRKMSQVAKGVNTDWMSQPLQNEINQKHSLYIDGGSEQVRFGVNLNYDGQNGVMKESSRNRYGAGITLDYRGRTFQMRNDVSYDIVESHDSPYGSFSDYTWKEPYDQIYDNNGNLQKNTDTWHSFGSSGSLNLTNPLYEALMTNNYSKGSINTLTDNLSMLWEIVPHLQLRGQFSVTKTENKNENYIDPASGRYIIGANTNYADIGQLTLGNSNGLSTNSNAFANYVRQFGDHNLNVSAGINIVTSTNDANNGIYTGFTSGTQHNPNLAAKIVAKPNFSDSRSRMFGSFFTLNYSFKDIYLLDLSSRLDGSSEFGSEKKYAPFWSVGTGVNLHKYDFLKDNPYISRARITANMGQLGKTNFPPYAAMDNYQLSNTWYSTGPGVSLYYMGNNALTWEKTNTYDLIFDLGLLKDRVTINVDLYKKMTKDLVNDLTLPLSTGFVQYKDNIGKVENNGFEVNIRADLYRSHDFMFAVYGNYAANRNKLLELSDALQEYNKLVDKQYADYNNYDSDDVFERRKRYATPHIKYVEGGSLTSVFGMKSLGINPADGQEIFVKKDGTITYDWDAAEQQIIGDTSPKGQGSFGINAVYKGISLYATFLYEYGGYEYNSTLVSKVENVDLYNRNADVRVLTDRWQKPGDVAMFKNIADNSFTTRPTSRFMQKYNLLSLNSLSLGYAFSKNLLDRMHVSLLRLQLTTNDVAKLVSVKQERGLDYPYARTFDLSLNVGF